MGIEEQFGLNHGDFGDSQYTYQHHVNVMLLNNVAKTGNANAGTSGSYAIFKL